MRMLAWCGGGDPPGSRKDEPDLVAESAEREDAAGREAERLWPVKKGWMRHE